MSPVDEVPCAYEHCSWVGSAALYATHLSECGFGLTECQNKGCEWRGPRKSLHEHLAKCEQLAVSCQCGWTGLPHELEDHSQQCAIRWRKVPSRRLAKPIQDDESYSRAAPRGPRHWPGRPPPTAQQKAPATDGKSRPATKEICGPAYRVPRPLVIRVPNPSNFQPPVSEDLALEWALQLSAQDLSSSEAARVQKDLLESDTEVCAVCLEPVSSEAGGLQLPRCGHVFHLPCVAALVAPKDVSGPSCHQESASGSRDSTSSASGPKTSLSCAICRMAYAWEELELPAAQLGGAEMGESSSLPWSSDASTLPVRAPPGLENLEASAEAQEGPVLQGGVSAPPGLDSPFGVDIPTNSASADGPDMLAVHLPSKGPRGTTATLLKKVEHILEQSQLGGPTEEEAMQRSQAAVEKNTKVVARSAWRSGRRGLAARGDLARAVFKECDVDDDGRLRSLELHSFAVETGFGGSFEVWTEEYSALCEERGIDTALGLPEVTFTAMLDDKTETGCFCSDTELRKVLERLRANRASRMDSFLSSPGSPRLKIPEQKFKEWELELPKYAGVFQ
eukprot:TRINITY_DN20711_c0_g1_i1.p1 TRINITY_DN20711_c0_g1~~TRINITY_DN20711_c0_g1_i1.p1  ORF type:complete len:571 (-),score=98.79 TRINITY_DN20711_c0_g1_i1:200-1888(-)